MRFRSYLACILAVFGLILVLGACGSEGEHGDASDALLVVDVVPSRDFFTSLSFRVVEQTDAELFKAVRLSGFEEERGEESDYFYVVPNGSGALNVLLNWETTPFYEGYINGEWRAGEDGLPETAGMAGDGCTVYKVQITSWRSTEEPNIPSLPRY